eukprot:gb/GFBE01051004.1/.p1 GENE.gb/GFBE01051004.1/~~gb/GFBE01051004.1/.p1  ORF type:complete len:677 (+),score=121.18 gb/GFBE01051004.1/:1-2031(+)
MWMQLLLCVAFLPMLVRGFNASKCKCYKRSAHREEHVLGPRMHEILSLAALPAQLDWRDKDGVNYATMSRNQHIPYYCGACYAFSTTSALSDRLRIAQGPSGPEVNLAVQVVLNCDTEDLGCDGGDGITVYKFIKNFGGIPADTCQPYVAEGHDTGKKCTALDVCRTCDSQGCFAQSEFNAYGVAEYGHLAGEHAMMAELQRGPIACSIATPDDFCNFVGDGIYEDLEGKSPVDHLISVVGYGEENGKKFWVVRNSWGTYWGHYGFIKVVRGKNNLKIEEDCVWATPSNGGRPSLHRVKEGLAQPGSAVTFVSRSGKEVEYEPIARVSAPDAPSCRRPWSDWRKVGGELVTSSRPHETLKASEVPKSWDWRNVSGISYVTSNQNEHNPQYCASCWAFGVTSALSDRLAVRDKGVWPKVGLSPQMLINCNGGGGCDGGDPAMAYAYIAQNGIVDMTCQSYRGVKLECNAQGICETCAEGNNEHGLVWPGKCTSVQTPVTYFVSQYGSVRGERAMKAEVYARGPIGCGLQATHGFRHYDGGVYSEDGQRWVLNHQVNVAGWGVAGHGDTVLAGTEFWIGRNSWGSTWGENGWFRVRMHSMNLGIEQDCDWGVPELGPAVPSTLTERSDSEQHQLGPVLVVSLLALVLLAAWQLPSWMRRGARAVRGEVDGSSPYFLIA